MKASYLIFLTMLMSSFSLGSRRPDALQLLREIRLSEHLKFCPTKNDPAAHPVFAVSFSPDEERLAVTLDVHPRTSGSQSHLLLIPIEPRGQSEQIEIPPLFVRPEFQSTPGIGWSPSGDSLIIGSDPQVFMHSRNKRTCEIRSAGGWYGVGFADETHLLSMWRRPKVKGGLESPTVTEVGLLGFDCQAVKKWEVEAPLTIMDSSVERGTIAATDSEALIVANSYTGEVKQRWPSVLWPWMIFRFADSGRVVCGGSSVTTNRRIPARCWEVDTGRKIFEPIGVNGGWPLSTAANGTRVLLSDVQYVKSWITDGYSTNLKRVVLFDVRSGDELASWELEKQKIRDRTDHWAFALSPTGKYYAEAGNGILRLYKISLKNGK